MRDESFLEYIINSNLSIKNVGCECSLVTRNRRDVLDISLSNERIIGLVSEWKMSSEPFMPCHRSVRFGLKVELKQLPSKRIPSNKNWDLFWDMLALNISRVGQLDSKATASGLERRLSALNYFITDVCHCDCILKAITKKRSCFRWFSKLSV